MLLLTNIAAGVFHDAPMARAVEQGHRLRVLVFGFGFVAAAAVLTEAGASILWLAALALNACLWPGLARAFALRSADPHAVEKRNLLIDSAMGGVWVALLQFNLLPSALLTTAWSCDKAMAGGWNLLLRGLVVQAAACVLTLALHGLEFAPQSSTAEILASLPLLVGYPLVIGLRLYRQQGTGAA